MLREGRPLMAGRETACLMVHCTRSQQDAAEGQACLLWRVGQGRP